MRYLKLASVGNAVEGINELRGMGKSVMLAIYHLGENHLECASEPLHPRDMEAKYHISSSELATIKRYARHDHALLAYDFNGGTVSLLDSFQEKPVSSTAAAIAIINVILNGAPMLEGTQFSDEPRREPQFFEPAPSPIRDDVPHYSCGGGQQGHVNIDDDPLSGLSGFGGLFGHID